MTIQEFILYCRDVSNKDSAGNGFSPDQFNGQVKIVSIEKFQSYWKLAENMAAANKEALAEVIFRLQELSAFVVPAAELNPSNSTVAGITFTHASFPDDYRFFLGMIIDDKPADLKSYTEIGKYRRGLLNGNPDERPLVFEGDEAFEFIPNDPNQVIL